MSSSLRRIALNVARVSVPLEDVIVPPSYSRKQDVPERDTFVKSYGRTKIPYNIIYVDFGDNYRFDSPLSVSDFKSALESLLPSLKSSDQRNEASFLLQPGVLKPKSVNILANFRDDQDINAQSVDHDFGHLLITEQVMELRGFTGPQVADVISSDYQITDVKNQKTYDNLSDIPDKSTRLASYEAIENLFGFILLVGNPIPDSISAQNISRDVGLDLLEDLVLLYNQQGETLENVNIPALTLYSYDGRHFTPSKRSNPLFIFSPKTRSIPNVTRFLRSALSTLSQHIQSSISDRVGNVFTLW